MPKFRVEVACRASCTEVWEIEGEDAASVDRRWNEEGAELLLGATFMFDRVDGDEEERVLVAIDDVASADQPNAVEMAVRDALSFVEGFEGDELQEGIDGPAGLIARLRGALAVIEGGA